MSGPYDDMIGLAADAVARAAGCLPVNDLPRFLADIRARLDDAYQRRFDQQADLARMWVSPDIFAEWEAVR